MAKFRVVFPRLVIYQAEHPKARREITELLVTAPDAASAAVHAMRVVQGDVTGLLVALDVPLPTVPPVEQIPDVCQEFR